MPDYLRDQIARLHDMAMRLLALALKTRAGDGEFLEQLVVAALACEEKATALEVGAAKPKTLEESTKSN